MVSVLDLLQPAWRECVREVRDLLDAGGDLDAYAESLATDLDRSAADLAAQAKEPTPEPVDRREVRRAVDSLVKDAQGAP
jgi:hypothetical protein